MRISTSYKNCVWDWREFTLILLNPLFRPLQVQWCGLGTCPFDSVGVLQPGKHHHSTRWRRRHQRGKFITQCVVCCVFLFACMHQTQWCSMHFQNIFFVFPLHMLFLSSRLSPGFLLLFTSHVQFRITCCECTEPALFRSDEGLSYAIHNSSAALAALSQQKAALTGLREHLISENFACNHRTKLSLMFTHISNCRNWFIIIPSDACSSKERNMMSKSQFLFRFHPLKCDMKQWVSGLVLPLCSHCRQTIHV